jgi:hypothetical protein
MLTFTLCVRAAVNDMNSIHRSILARSLMAAAVSMIFTITEHPRVHAEAVIGADGAAGYFCPDFYTGRALGEMLATASRR